MVSIHDTPAGASFAVKLHPRARKNAITGEIGDALKLSLNLPRSSITIASGLSSRRKVIRVSGLSAGEVQKRLGIQNEFPRHPGETR